MKSCCMKVREFFFIIVFSISFSNANSLENCNWNNSDGIPCVTINKTPNTSKFNSDRVKKFIISRKDITNSGAVDANDVLKLIPGLDVFQSVKKVNKHQFLLEVQSLITRLFF